MHQLDTDKLTDLMDVCMVWVWLKPHLTGLFGTQQMADVQKMWANGSDLLHMPHVACDHMRMWILCLQAPGSIRHTFPVAKPVALRPLQNPSRSGHDLQ